MTPLNTPDTELKVAEAAQADSGRPIPAAAPGRNSPSAGEADREARALRRSALLTTVTGIGLVSGLVAAWLGAPSALTWSAYGAAYLAGGVPLTSTVSTELFARRISIDLLMLLAALAAAAVGEVPDGAVLLFLFSLANTLEEYALGRTKRAVESLMKLRPETALLLTTSGDIEPVPVDSLAVGNRVLVRPGERIPADGQVVEGGTSVDESMLTGESMPVDKTFESQVFAGTVNGYGAITVQVTKLATETTLARMIKLVTEAQKERSTGQRLGDWFGERYTLAVLGGTALALPVFLIIGFSWSDALYKIATLLVVASPCAVVISVPAATLAALAAAARRGVLFKGAAALEELAQVSVLAMDKTGTLTYGKPAVADVMALRGSEEELLRLAAGLELASEHPIAKSILAEAARRGIESSRLPHARTLPGQGMIAQAGQVTAWAGTRHLAGQQGVTLTPEEERILEKFEHQGKSTVLLGSNELMGFITVADAIRPQAFGLFDSLRKVGIERFVMLTGDHETSALEVAGQLGLDRNDVHASLLPEDKLRWIKRLSQEGKTAFVGDGVNDAAALVSANLGIAMGAAGSDVALETADVILLADDLSRLDGAIRMSRAANLVVRQNLVFAVGAMIVLVAFTLFGDLPLPLAVIGHEGGTLLVVANGLRLLGLPVPRSTKRSRS